MVSPTSPRFDADGNGWSTKAGPGPVGARRPVPGGELKPPTAAGVGALHVGSAWSPFALKDENNAALGQIWRSGVHLTEDGRAGRCSRSTSVRSRGRRRLPLPAPIDAGIAGT